MPVHRHPTPRDAAVVPRASTPDLPAPRAASEPGHAPLSAADQAAERTAHQVADEMARALRTAESAAAASFAVLAELAPCGVFRVRPDGRLEDANRLFADMVGLRAEGRWHDPHVDAFDWLDGVDPDDHDELFTTLRSAAAGRPREIIVRVIGRGAPGKWVRLTMAPARPRGDLLVGTAQDVVQRATHLDSLLLDSQQDPLTGVMNRFRVHEVIEELLSSQRRSDRDIAVLAIHLTGLGDALTHHGVSGAEYVLREASRRIRRTARTEDVVARWDDDAFIVVVRYVASVEEAWAAATRHHAALCTPYDLGGVRREIGVRIGLGMPDAGSITVAERI